ncbi:MAG: AlwI family type II restriction endonuclease [Prevotella sp.]|nr:AlwI family type II restriction endonuclease [Prevotella sp.]
MASAVYKPLLYTTTMRNPGRLKFMLYVLNGFSGRILNDDLATLVCGETIRYGLYRPMKQSETIKNKWKSSCKGEFSDYLLTDKEVEYMLDHNPQEHKEAGFVRGWPSRFATIFDLTKELGLAYYAPSEPIYISELGQHLLESFNVEVDESELSISVIMTHPEYEQQVFLQAMARSQRKNPFVRVLNDNIPLILLLQVIQKLNADNRQNGAGLSRKEIPLLLFWKDNNAEALYSRIVKLRQDYGYSPSDEVIVDICVNEIMEGSFKKFKIKSIVDEYPDEFIRKMRMTGLISLRGAGRFISINSNEQKKVEYILKHYAVYETFSDERAYFNYMSSLDRNLISVQAVTMPKNRSEELLAKWLKSYSWEKIKTELTVLEKKKASNDSIMKLLSAPSRLEFLTALAIKSRMPHVRVIPNYTCDDTGLPTSTAGGNKGDIECYEYHRGILVEVTMSGGRTQTMMEIRPIERHLDDMLREMEAQCIFIAPEIYSDSLSYIDFVKFQSDNKKIIRAYDIQALLRYLETQQSLYEIKLSSLSQSDVIKKFVDTELEYIPSLTVLTLMAELIKEFGEHYPNVSRKEWYTMTRDYIKRKTRIYDISDNEPIMWRMVADGMA